MVILDQCITDLEQLPQIFSFCLKMKQNKTKPNKHKKQQKLKNVTQKKQNKTKPKPAPPGNIYYHKTIAM